MALVSWEMAASWLLLPLETFPWDEMRKWEPATSMIPPYVGPG